MGILYFFCVEHCNRLGWKKEFGLPTQMAMEAIGIRSYNTYIKTLHELVDYGFIIMVEKSKNQYSSNIIALSNFDKALDKAPTKALDKAMIKHLTKHSESTYQSNDSINKHITINIEPINKEHSYVGETSSPQRAPIKKAKKHYLEFNPEDYEPALIEKYNKFNEWIDTRLPNIRHIENQITIDEYQKIIEANIPKQVLTDKFEYLANTEAYWKGKSKKNSVYLTITTWIRNDSKR